MYLTEIAELSANCMYSAVNVYMIVNQWAEVGRVLKNCTQVKVKVIIWIVTWVRVKKYWIKKLLM